MMRAIVLLTLIGVAAAATPAVKAAPVAKTIAPAAKAVKPVAKAAPLVAKKVAGPVALSAEQKKVMHWGCVSACKPTPIEAKCATACEAKMYRCIDETGPNEDEKDTKKCQDKVLKLYEETKGVEKKEEKKDAKKGDKKEAKKGEKKEAKKEEKKAKMFLQVADVDDDEIAYGDDAEEESTSDEFTGDNEETSSMEEQDSPMSEDEAIEEETSAEDETGDYSESSDLDESVADEESQDAQAVADEEETQGESSGEEAEEGEESQEDSAEEEEETPEDGEESSLVQVTKGSDDDDTEAADTATTETEDAEASAEDDAASKDEAAPEEEASEEAPAATEEESLVQVSGNDDGNDEVAEVASEEDKTDKVEGEEEEKSDEDQKQDRTDEEKADDEEEADAEKSDSAEESDSFMQVGSSWKPEPCGELAPGVPCTKLYEHPQGSTFVTACPVGEQTNPEACGAFFGDKAAGDQCPQISCSKALGVTMKLICGGGCCPTCWAPDHVIAVDRHTTVDDAAVVDSAPQAPSTCGGVKCFKLACAAGYSEGFVNGACCNSCVTGR